MNHILAGRCARLTWLLFVLPLCPSLVEYLLHTAQLPYRKRETGKITTKRKIKRKEEGREGEGERFTLLTLQPMRWLLSVPESNKVHVTTVIGERISLQPLHRGLRHGNNNMVLSHLPDGIMDDDNTLRAEHGRLAVSS